MSRRSRQTSSGSSSQRQGSLGFSLTELSWCKQIQNAGSKIIASVHPTQAIFIIQRLFKCHSLSTISSFGAVCPHLDSNELNKYSWVLTGVHIKFLGSWWTGKCWRLNLPSMMETHTSTCSSMVMLQPKSNDRHLRPRQLLWIVDEHLDSFPTAIGKKAFRFFLSFSSHTKSEVISSDCYFGSGAFSV